MYGISNSPMRDLGHAPHIPVGRQLAHHGGGGVKPKGFTPLPLTGSVGGPYITLFADF
jgi:hypothetical protein